MRLTLVFAQQDWKGKLRTPLARSASGLEISDSATALGTYTVVPEPSCVALCLVALLSLLARHKRQLRE